jgi:hypothetical protein
MSLGFGSGSRMRPWSSLLLLVLAACSAGCDSSSLDFTPIDGVPPGQVTFHFKMHGDASGIQDFRAATNDPAVMAAVRAELLLPENERRLFIIGPIDRENGGHNLEWNWHFLPGEWALTEFAIELCDGNAVLVSQDVDYWIDTVGQFCPWGSYAAYEVSAETGRRNDLSIDQR